MSAPFTPGPWEANEYGLVYAPQNGTSHLICDCVGDDERERPTETEAANARLIAAAPMLFALIQQVAVPGGIGPHEFTRPGGWLERAQAALAKATGAAP